MTLARNNVAPWRWSYEPNTSERKERKPTRCNNIDDLLSIVDVDFWHCLNMFRAYLCPSSGERPRVTACEVYLLVVLDVAGCGTVVLRWGCDHCEGCLDFQLRQRQDTYCVRSLSVCVKRPICLNKLGTYLSKKKWSSICLTLILKMKGYWIGQLWQ